MSDLAPSESKIQQESLQFNQPTSGSSAAAIGALANAMREIMVPVGTIIYSVLDETTFQDENDVSGDERWVLADGRSVTGSTYESLTGNSNIPDLRGVFIRGKNYARSTGTGNPDGDLTVGDYTTDRNKEHNHGITDGAGGLGHNHGITDLGHKHNFSNTIGTTSPRYDDDTDFSAYDVFGDTPLAIQNALTGITVNNATTGITIQNDGSTDNAPRNITLNPFIRIN